MNYTKLREHKFEIYLRINFKKFSIYYFCKCDYVMPQYKFNQIQINESSKWNHPIEQYVLE